MSAIIKFLLRLLLRLLYRVKTEGLEHFKSAGDRVLIVANHPSLLDGILLFAFLPGHLVFTINTVNANSRKYKLLLSFVELFIMDPNSPLAVKSLIKLMRENRKAVIFPEGRISDTGVLMKIYEGTGLAADKSDATVLPVAIDGAQLSTFSGSGDEGYRKLLPRIRIRILPPEKFYISPGLKGHSRRMAAAHAIQKIMLNIYYATYDHDRSLFAAFLDSVRKFGRKQVVLEDLNREKLNYGSLLTRVFILARLLEGETRPGEHVGILLPNVNATVISFLALQFCRRITAMLNYTSGIQAILRSCHVAGIKTVITSHRFVANANLTHLVEELAGSLKIVYLEDLRAKLTFSDKLAGISGSLRPESYYRDNSGIVSADSPAVILFTSGSEGIPKGVVLSHRNLLSNYAQVRCHINFNRKDIIFSCLPFFHSFGLNAGFLMPMLGGSKIYIYPTPLHYRIIPELIYEIGATILFGTSTFFKGYARHANTYDFHTLRFAIAGAEKLRDDTRQIWMDKFGIKVYEGYGVTETSPVISVNTPVINRTRTVGRLMPGMQSYLKPVEGIDEGGKLIVNGPNVMLGYFLADNPGVIQPPRTERGPGWHDTGDIASIDRDGYISILGRAKRFAKIGGEMISLTAVEELAMETWPSFNHAAISIPDERKGEKIILVSDNFDATRKQIQEKARELKYGELYIPRKVILAEEMPLLSTGKTDYVNLTKLVIAEDKEGSGLISRITHMIKKSEESDYHKADARQHTDNNEEDAEDMAG